MPGGRARDADRAVAGRAVEEVPPGLRAARRGPARRRRAGPRPRLQPVRRPPPRGGRPGDARGAAGADAPARPRPASTSSWWTRPTACAARPATRAARRGARWRPSPRSAATSCSSPRSRSTTTCTASSACSSCCAPPISRRARPSRLASRGPSRSRPAPARRDAWTSAACRPASACPPRARAAGRRRLELVDAVRGAPAPHALGRRQKADRVRRALASGAALQALLGRDDAALARLAERADAADPRMAWLAGHAPRWREAGEKTLVFVAHRETLEWIRTELSRRAQVATGVFHEELSSARRDIEVAQFRLSDGPSLLVSTECGGEGRNFEFCRRIVLFDLPWSPLVVGAAHRPARSHRPPPPGRDRLLRPARGHRPRRRAALRGAGPLPRAARRPRARARPRGGGARDGGALPRGRPLRGALRRDRRRRARRAVADSRGGLAGDAPRPLPARAGRRDPRARPARSRRAQRGSRHHRLRAAVSPRRAARRPRLLDRARQPRAGGQPARCPGRDELPRHLRPRGGRRRREDRLLRRRPPARGRPARPPRGVARWAA